jgi:glutathione synthase/RimK-type ligase-like ATP-grasp enzyme
MSVLVVTRSDDSSATPRVLRALEAMGEEPVRFDTDLYPQEVGLSTRLERGRVRRLLTTPRGRFDLGEATAVWYRRFLAGGRLPESLGDMREPSVTEARRTVYGTIAALGVFELDPLACVRRADHKELQLARAHAHGLDTPRTLFTNEPDAARAFWEELEGRVITKMQSSFSLEREGREAVVFTNRVRREDLDALEGLRACPMTFQERVPKACELRVTVVGRRAFAASIDSQQSARAALDWRRDGAALIGAWKPYVLPPEVERGLLAVVADFGLHYAAADIIVTPEGRHVFLEINAGGEWAWLDEAPGLPIAQALAEVLTGRAERVPSLLRHPL